jgi:hypothetical protein
MLSEKQKTKVINAVEEELKEMDQYKGLSSSRVPVFSYDGLSVQVVVTRNTIDDEEE